MIRKFLSGCSLLMLMVVLSTNLLDLYPVPTAAFIIAMMSVLWMSIPEEYKQ